jgi:hypothetical protein
VGGGRRVLNEAPSTTLGIDLPESLNFHPLWDMHGVSVLYVFGRKCGHETNLVNDAQRREEQAYQDSHIPIDRREHVVQREISKARDVRNTCELGLGR